MRLRLTGTANLGYEFMIAETLFSLGARPPIVRAVCHIGKKTAIRLYKTFHQRSPRQGMLPYDPYWIVRSSVHNTHASIFLGLIHDFSQQQSQAVVLQNCSSRPMNCIAGWSPITLSPASWKRGLHNLFC